MISEPFSESARHSIVMAQEEAKRLGDQDIHTCHLLLGILAESNSAAARALQAFGVTLDAARAQAEKHSRGPGPAAEAGFSDRSKRIIESAFGEARMLNHNHISAEHLTLSLLKKNDGSAAAILTALGADRDAIRAGIIASIKVTEQATLDVRQEIATGRSIYLKSQLREDAVDGDALIQLQRWLDEAYEAKVAEPNAMALSTVDPEGQPSARVVLLRKLDADGLVFYTSYLSRKARAMQHNSRAALLFYWAELERQVRVEGTIEPVSDEQSDEYFASRPRGHQLGAWASEQSEIVESRELLDQRLHQFESRFEGQDVPRPHSWGGYILKPLRVEFWQGRPNRLHDRLLYTREAQQWQIVRLSP
ncbi:MAG: pyridoxamine 5'-phosphate oxidase [Candidatus Eremiobacteraeota bacterium]|nr:pyridoxamine 5'-phosphate oxidase [Candidatus Eremiobacteraeota bacterium]